jgi:uncharacterized SAM-binding protein YcdF (DUF218 family)
MKRTLWFIGLSGVVILFGLGLYLTDASLLNLDELRSFLKKRLVKEVPANELVTRASHDSNGIIYVLGGSQQSLESRFKKASALYRKGAAGKVLIMSRRGTTEYSPRLGRNWTNDEWAIDRLVGLGVKNTDIEIVSIAENFGGTYHEAKAISDLTLKRGYRYLLLVSSRYHTRRVWDSFSKMLQGRNVSLYVYPSDDPSGFKELVIEYIKLLTYDNLLLPLSRDTGRAGQVRISKAA